MPLSKSPEAFKLRTLFMGSLGEIPESQAEPKGSWLEGVLPKRSNRDASLDESAMFSQPDSVW